MPRTRYDTARPWNYIFIKAAEDIGFWAKEVMEKAVVAQSLWQRQLHRGMRLTGMRRLRSVYVTMCRWRSVHPFRAASQVAQAASKKRSRPTSFTRAHNIENGRLTTNCRGRPPLCPGFQIGQFWENPDKMHQCAICLSFSHAWWWRGAGWQEICEGTERNCTSARVFLPSFNWRPWLPIALLVGLAPQLMHHGSGMVPHIAAVGTSGDSAVVAGRSAPLVSSSASFPQPAAEFVAVGRWKNVLVRSNLKQQRPREVEKPEMFMKLHFPGGASELKF
eukprot:6336089-Amphidinium_carterae.1